MSPGPEDALPEPLARYVEGLKAHDLAGIRAAVAPDVRFVTPARTLDRDEFLALLGALYAAFPDWSYAHDPPRRQGDVIALRWRQGGTHTGVLALPGAEPVAPTGRKVRIPEQFFFYTLRNGALVEIRPDPIPGGAPRGILEQIGVAQPPL